MADRRIKTGERDAIQELSKREMEDVQGGIIATANGSIASAEGLAILAHPSGMSLLRFDGSVDF